MRERESRGHRIMKKTVEGWLFNRIEKLGGREYNHIGCEGENGSFSDFLASFVPKVGMKRRARFTIETIGNFEKGGNKH